MHSIQALLRYHKLCLKAKNQKAAKKARRLLRKQGYYISKQGQ